MGKQKSDSHKDKGKAGVKTPADLELDPDAWPKFEALVKDAAKMGHKPHEAKLGKIARAKPKGKK